VILPSGAELRVTGTASTAAVVCVNGGQGSEVEGTWSASLEWLVQRLAPSFPDLAFGEVRYRVKSWNTLDRCIEDAREAVQQVGAQRTLLVGFSMGGIVSSQIAADPSVETVVGLAPWFPDRLPLEPLRGKRLRVLHGSLDRALPGIPGVSPASSRRGFDRAVALGADGEYTIIHGAVHGVAVRAHRGGRPLPLPRARTWARLVADELRRFQAPG
jgi:pimeloyl-ACP methyl ester carboxylesterase